MDLENDDFKSQKSCSEDEKIISTLHQSFITDIAYDHYGRRLATCSADQTVRIVERTKDGLGWDDERAQKIGGFNSQIVKVAWAHPEYGQVLACCCDSGEVVVLEEQEGMETPLANNSNKTEVSGYKFRRKWSTRDGNGKINDIEFAPRHMGMKIATASDDGVVRIYVASDTLDLSHWQLQAKFSVAELGGSATCLSWNKGTQFEVPMLAIGTRNKADAKLSSAHVWRYHKDTRQWAKFIEFDCRHYTSDIAWAPVMGRSYHLIATASDDGVRIFKFAREDRGEELKIDSHLDHIEVLKSNRDDDKTKRLNADASLKSECVQWNVAGTILASSGENKVTLWRMSPETGHWQKFDSLQ